MKGGNNANPKWDRRKGEGKGKEKGGGRGEGRRDGTKETKGLSWTGGHECPLDEGGTMNDQVKG